MARYSRRLAPERSVLAFGVSRNAAASLGRRFRQNAVVFVRCGKVPELLIHQHGTVYIAIAALTRCLRRRLARGSRLPGYHDRGCLGGVRNIGDRKRRCACFRELVGDADRGFGAHPTRLNHQAWGLVFSGSAQFRDAYLDTDYIVHSNGGLVVIRMTRSGHATRRLPLDRASYVNCGAREKCRRIGCELYCSDSGQTKV